MHACPAPARAHAHARALISSAGTLRIVLPLAPVGSERGHTDGHVLGVRDRELGLEPLAALDVSCVARVDNEDAVGVTQVHHALEHADPLVVVEHKPRLRRGRRHAAAGARETPGLICMQQEKGSAVLYDAGRTSGKHAWRVLVDEHVDSNTLQTVSKSFNSICNDNQKTPVRVVACIARSRCDRPWMRRSLLVHQCCVCRHGASTAKSTSNFACYANHLRDPCTHHGEAAEKKQKPMQCCGEARSKHKQKCRKFERGASRNVPTSAALNA
eukprot:6194895-Pleurochrysis_carterae.AAC.2